MQKSVKKRLFVVLLCLMALMALCFSLVACGGDTKYKLTIADYDTEQGTVTVTPEAEGNEYKKDTEVTVEARGKEGYVVDTFTVDTNADASLNNEGKFTFKITADTTITVTFKSTTVKVTGVALDKETLALEIGGLATKAEATLQATVSPTNATNKNVSWASDAEGIATVDSTGKVTAVAVGTANITVTTEDGGMTKTCAVTVAQHQHSAAAGATYTPLQDGENHSYECETCGQTVQEKHTMDTKWHSGQDGHYHECEKCHVPDLPQQHSHGSGSLTNKGEDGHSYVCVVCENTITVSHNLGAKESVGESGHKQSCDCGYSTTVTGHTLVYEILVEGSVGKHKQVCSEHCGYETEAVSHTTTWQTDEQQHWKGCICGLKLQATNHTWTWRVDDDGKHYQCCTASRTGVVGGEECGYETPHEDHTPSGDWQKEADKHYKICSECSNHCLESSHSELTWLKKDSAGHQFKCGVCEYESDLLSHSPGPDGRTCQDCGYKMECQHFTVKYISDGELTHKKVCANPECGAVLEEKMPCTFGTTLVREEAWYKGEGKCDDGCGNSIFTFDSTTKTIKAYKGGTLLQYLEIPSSIDGVDVEAVGTTSDTTGVFASNTTLLKVVFPDSVQTYGTKLFAASSVVSVKFGKGTSGTLKTTFQNCASLEEVEIANQAGITFTTTFTGCTSLQKVVIHTMPTSIGKSTFNKCTNVQVYFKFDFDSYDATKNSDTTNLTNNKIHFYYAQSPSSEEQQKFEGYGKAWHYVSGDVIEEW